MTHRILTSLICSTSILFVTSGILYAASQTYEDYQKEADTYCNSSARSWAADNTIVPKIDYPKFDTATVNTTIKKWREDPRVVNTAEKMQLQTELDPAIIGNFSGFKTLEVARIGYRSRMNGLFACASISSRIDTINNLQKLIGKKVKIENSEILKNLENITKKLNETNNTLKCNIIDNKDGQKKQEMVTKLTNTAAHQYCHYRHYLSYLDSNIEDVTQAQNIEKGIGQGSGTSMSNTISSWNASSMQYKSALSSEIMRADTTLPKALRTLVEMDRTYGVHILLTLIYDDYIRLRGDLSKYMNTSSQLYQKANNAQKYK